jgi:hypothetical protein
MRKVSRSGLKVGDVFRCLDGCIHQVVRINEIVFEDDRGFVFYRSNNFGEVCVLTLVERLFYFNE